MARGPCSSPCYGSVYTILNNANSLTWLNLSSSKPCAGVTTDKKYNLGTVFLCKLPSFSNRHFKNNEKRILLFLSQQIKTCFENNIKRVQYNVALDGNIFTGKVCKIKILIFLCNKLNYSLSDSG